MDIVKICEMRNFDLKGHRELILFLYRYTNARLIELLEITEAEQVNLGSIIGTREKYRRNNERRTPRNKNGNTNKQQELLDKKNEVLILKNKGYSLRDIAKSLDISLGKVQRLLKK